MQEKENSRKLIKHLHVIFNIHLEQNTIKTESVVINKTKGEITYSKKIIIQK